LPDKVTFVCSLSFCFKDYLLQHLM